MKTDEHVIQAAFDAALRLVGEVCTVCNTNTFSAEDKRFVDFVKRYLCYPQSGFKGLPLIHGRPGLSFDADLGVWTTMRHVSKGIWTALPQIVQCPDTSWRSLVATISEATRMFAELSHNGPTLRIETDVVGGLEPPMQPTILRSGKGKFMVKGASSSLVDGLVRQIREGRFQPYGKESQPHERSRLDPIDIQGEIPLGSIARSLAKNTVNFLCKVYGSQVARSPDLADIKNVALGRRNGLVDAPIHIWLSGRREISHLDRAIAGAARHAMMLAPMGVAGAVQVVTWLYRTPIGMVDVPTAAIAGDAQIAVLLVDDEGKHRILRMPDHVEWFGAFLEQIPSGVDT